VRLGGQGSPIDLGSRVNGFSAPNKVPHYTSNMAAHLGFRFQEAARYHMEARSTWFATRILPASERRQVLQLISLPLMADNILSKLASGGDGIPPGFPDISPLCLSGSTRVPLPDPTPILCFFCWPRSLLFCANLFLLPTHYRRCPGLFASFPYCRAFLLGRALCRPQKSSLLFSLLPGGLDLLLRNGGHRACAQGHLLPK